MKHGADRPARLHARGFTLIEMLVAIALLAVIALLWRGLDATIRGRDDIASNLAQTRLLGRYFSQLQFDLMNLVTADEVFGPPLRIRPNELVMVRRLGVGSGPTHVQVVRYRLNGRALVRSASQPLATLAEVDAALRHMDDFAQVVVSSDARAMQLAVWIAPAAGRPARPRSSKPTRSFSRSTASAIQRRSGCRCRAVCASP
jgi:general secretion pathway protein J